MSPLPRAYFPNCVSGMLRAMGSSLSQINAYFSFTLWFTHGAGRSA